MMRRLASRLKSAAAAACAVDDGGNHGQSPEFNKEAAKFRPFFHVNFHKSEGQSLGARSADNDLRADRAKTMIDLQMEQRSRSSMAVAGRQAAPEVQVLNVHTEVDAEIGSNSRDGLRQFQPRIAALANAG